MVCKKCGKRIRKDTEFCPHCEASQKETVSLGALAARDGKKKKQLSRRQRILRIVLTVTASVAAAALLAVLGVWLFLDSSIQHGSELDESNLGINDELPVEGVVNIALFGLDDRDTSADGHSDAIIILSIDRVHNKVKMTSIARDTLVPVDGYPSREHKTKITHAFSYGGVNLAVKTLNQNFGMNIKDYVYVNFLEFAEIIDFLGGVTINVQQKELNELNKHVYWMRIECDMEIEKVERAGEQRLSGGQALAYARVRKVDSDIQRGNRQKDVLQAMFDEVKTQPISKFPALVNKILSICHTNMSSSEMISIATWALASSPEFENNSLPDDSCKSWGGSHPYYDWVWIYDLQYATARLHDFIYETDAASLMSPTRYYLPGTTTTTAPSSTTAPDPTGTDHTTTAPPDVSDPTDSTTGTDPDTSDGTTNIIDGSDPTGTGDNTTDPTGDGGDTTTEDGGDTTTEDGDDTTTEDGGDATTTEDGGDTTTTTEEGGTTTTTRGDNPADDGADSDDSL